MPIFRIVYIDDDTFAPPLEETAEKLLVLVRAVHIRGVEEIHPQLERALERRYRFRFVGRSVELRHAHTAEPLLRNYQSLIAKSALFHC